MRASKRFCRKSGRLPRRRRRSAPHRSTGTRVWRFFEQLESRHLLSANPLGAAGGEDSTASVLRSDESLPEAVEILPEDFANLEVQPAAEFPALAPLPGPQSTWEDTPLIFSETAGNGISLSYDGDDSLAVILSASHGTLSLASLDSLQFVEGDGLSDPIMQFEATVDAINTALDGLQFLPTPGYYGDAALTITVPGTGLPTDPEADNGTNIDNDVASGIPGYFNIHVLNGGEADIARVTVEGKTESIVNQNFLYEFLNYVDVGGDGQAVNLGDTNITSAANVPDYDYVVSEGEFAGENGTIRWRVDTWLSDGGGTVYNQISFSSELPLGDLQFINYLDEDVLSVGDDVLHLVGTPGEANFRVFTLDNSQRVGFSQGGVYQSGNGLTNATFDGWTADRFSDLQDAITGTGTDYSVEGNINTVTLPELTDPDLGQIYGPSDITTAFAWTVDPTATEATITTFLELVAVDPAAGTVLIDVQQDIPFNTPPTTTGINNVTNQPGGQATVDLFAAFSDAEDADSELAYAFSVDASHPLFDAVTFNNTTGLLTLDFADAEGTVDVTVTATDTEGESVAAVFTVSLVAENTPPTTTGIDDILQEPNTQATIDLFAAFSDAEDADSELAYTFSVDASHPLFDAVTFNNTTGLLTLDFADAEGTVDVTVTATDTEGESVAAVFTVSLVAENTPPTTTGIEDIHQQPNTQATVDLFAAFSDAEDADSELAYTFSVDASHPLFDAVTFNNATGLLTLDFADAEGTVDVTVTATDTEGESVAAVFTVSLVAENAPPTTTGIDDILQEPNTQATIDLFAAFSDAEDADSELAYTFSVDASHPLFDAVTFNNTTGLLTLDFADAEGTVDVTVTATDTEGESVAAVFTVSLVAENAPPTTTGIDDILQEPNTQATIDLFAAFSDAEDADSELAYTFSVDASHPLFDAVTFNNTTGLLTLDFADAEGTVDVTVTATDTEGESVSTTFAVLIETESIPPEVIGTNAAYVFVDDEAVGLRFQLTFGEELFTAAPVDGQWPTAAANNPANYRIVDMSTGQVLDSTDIDVVYYSATSQAAPYVVVDASLSTALSSVGYQLTFFAGNVVDLADNPFATETLQVSLSSVPPRVLPQGDDGVRVRAVTPLGGDLPNTILIELSDLDLNVAEATNPANYLLERLDSTGVTVLPITQVAYDPYADRLVLRGFPPLALGQYRLTVYTEPDAAAGAATGITSAGGVAVDGDGDGAPGGQLVEQFVVDQTTTLSGIDQILFDGNFRSMNLRLEDLLSQMQLAEDKLASAAFAQRLLADVREILAAAAEDESSEDLATAVNQRITSQVAARYAEVFPGESLPFDFVVVWGANARFLLQYAVELGISGVVGVDASGDLVTTFQRGVVVEGDDGLSLAILPVERLGELFTNELVTRADGSELPNGLGFDVELQGQAATNQAGLLYFKADEALARFAWANKPLESEVRRVDLNDVFGTTDPLVEMINEEVLATIVDILGPIENLPENLLIIWFDPVDFVLEDAQGNTGSDTSAEPFSGIANAYYGGSTLTGNELLVIPNALSGIYTLQLVGVGGQFRGAANFVQGGTLRTVPFEGHLGAAQNLMVQLDFRSPTTVSTLGLSTAFATVFDTSILPREQAVALNGVEIQTALGSTGNRPRFSDVGYRLDYVGSGGQPTQTVLEVVLKRLFALFADLPDDLDFFSTLKQLFSGDGGLLADPESSPQENDSEDSPDTGSQDADSGSAETSDDDNATPGDGAAQPVRRRTEEGNRPVDSQTPESRANDKRTPRTAKSDDRNFGDPTSDRSLFAVEQVSPRFTNALSESSRIDDAQFTVALQQVVAEHENRERSRPFG